MNRLLLLLCCLTGCLLDCLAQKQLPPYGILQQLLKKEHPDTTDMRVLLDAGYAYVLRPGNTAADMDSASLYAAKVLGAATRKGDKIWEGQACLLYSNILREQNNNEKGKPYALKAEAIFAKDSSREYLADTYRELANYYTVEPGENLDKRISYFRDAIRLYEQAGAKEKLAQSLYILGDYYNVINNFPLVTEYTARAVAIYDEIKIEPGADVYSLLGLGYNRMGDYGNALKYNLLAAKVAESLKDTIGAHATVYNRLGLIYFYMGEQDEALKYYNKAWEIARKLKDTATLRTLAINMSSSYVTTGKFKQGLAVMKGMERNYPPVDFGEKLWMYIFIAGCYLDLKQMDAATPYIRQVQAGRAQLPDILKASADDIEARYYFDNGQYQKAHDLYKSAMTFGLKIKNLYLQSVSCRGLYKTDSAMGNFEEALAHHRLYKILNDSLFNISRARKISTLQVQYETRQKDQALQLKEQNIELLTRKAQLQSVALDKARFTRNVIIAGAAMLVIMLGLGYNRYQLKLRSNRQMKQKQDEINQKNQALQRLIATQHKLLGEKEWLVKEIHHRVKNNLQIVMSLLNTQAAFLDDKDALNAIRESRYRMQAISLIHQKLYQSENMALIDMSNYIRDLVEYLKDGFSGVNNIRFDIQIDPVKLDVSQSVPIGLILNEAITNSIKYAFTGNGIISVSLLEAKPGTLTLTIADNGSGLPQGGNDPGARRSMGMMLMNTLAEQLEGTLNIESRNGVIITVNFKYQEKQAFTAPVELGEEITDYA